MLIFELVSPVFWVVFLVATVAAAFVHWVSGNHQKITMTFLLMVGVVFWLGNEPWTEPFPHAIKAIVILATMFQIIFAGLARLVRKQSLK
ncbi:hypothetical protein [Pseudomonas sichuanensis]|uniref:hypothetical protein n=1 Tax=Pseudomonas sichuanensis TaxID=2213015 RepID=UPI002AB9672E|nr:hypothetical protein [Pseudomonas sichuanensis]MDZ4021010.1 hypothetical protein [Pseudomonas sichuanensis]